MVNVTTTPGKSGLPNIFRQEAIDALNSTQEDEIKLNVNTPGAWLWLTCCLLLLVSIIIWGVFYNLTLTIEAPGIIISGQQLMEAERFIAQTLKDKNDKAAELFELYNKKTELYAKHYLTRYDLRLAKDEYEAAHSDLVESKINLQIPILQEETKPPIIAILFVNYLHGKKISLRMVGHIAPTSTPNNRVTGHVIGVSQYPATRHLSYYYLKNSSMVDNYFSHDTPFLIEFKPDTDAVSPGTPIVASISYVSCTPLQLLIKTTACD